MTVNIRLSFSKTLLTLSFLAFFSALTSLSAQTTEDCTNGKDDDGDGLIDCYDQDCTCTGQCDDFYYTTCNADCFYIPPCGQISLGIQWTGQAETGTYSNLVAGDMDKDGIPDIVTTRVEAPDLYIIDGATGVTKVHIVAPTDFAGGTAPAIADLDHDGFGEIVIVGNDRRLRCYEHDGTLKYVSAIQVGYNNRYRFSVPNIADFDNNGWAEVNIGNQVFNGQTGALLAQGGQFVSAGEHPARVANGFSFCSTVPMDVLPDNFCPSCAGLEIVAGNQVLSVNLVTGIVFPVVSAPFQFSDGFTSVADLDRDGDLDAIVQGRKNGQNTVYCWDIQTPTILRQYALLNNWQEGASRVNVADLNGDGQLEVSFVSYPYLYALRNDFSLMWANITNDVSSVTCSSVFDFCGDGSADIIYRGQTKLQILDGATGLISWEDDCLSATHIENPLVLDVDADGQTEIVIECGTDGTSNLGSVVVYEAIGTPGIASRQVWNQHGYFNTNINDDLSVPQFQQNPHIIGDSLKMNTFMNQFFNPTFPSPDGKLSFENLICVGDSLEITLRVCNMGDNLLPPITPVSVYQGNPQTSAAAWLGSTPIGFGLLPDSCRSLTFRFPRGAPDSVFVVLNDDHSQPAPFSLAVDFPVTTIGECSFVDNIVGFRFPYAPELVNIGADTAICDNTTITIDASGNDLISWQWQDGPSTPVRTLGTAGTFILDVSDVCGIIQTDTIVITIDSSTVVSIGADQVLCAGETVALSQSGFDYYIWGPATVVNCTNCPGVIAAPVASGIVVLEAGFANGCLNRDTLYITVNDTFNYTIDTAICFGLTVQWNGQTIPPDENRTFFLQTAQGCDSTVQVRVHGIVLATIQVDTAVCLGSTLPYNGFDLAPGDEKTIVLTAGTGCDSTVLIKVMPKDTFSTKQDIVLCDGESIPIFGQTQNATGIYQQTFIAKNGCDSTHTVNLTVFEPILLTIDAVPACAKEATGALTLSVSGDAPPFVYQWNLAGATSAQLSELPAGAYTVTVTDANDCTESAAANVASYPPIIFAVTTDSVRCFGQSNGAIVIETPDTSLVFSLDGNVFSQQLNWPDLPAEAYEVQAQDVYGCIDTLPANVAQPPQLLVSLPADTSITLGETLTILVTAFGLDSVTYSWENPAYLSCLDCPAPLAQPLTTIRYALTLTDVNGCTASDQMLVNVQRVIGVFVPNVFSPESDLLNNNRFDVNFGPAVERIKLMRIYDRWGSLVHEVNNAAPNDPATAWDGRVKGKDIAPGVYLWILELELVDGATVNYEGDVTVIR